MMGSRRWGEKWVGGEWEGGRGKWGVGVGGVGVGGVGGLNTNQLSPRSFHFLLLKRELSNKITISPLFMYKNRFFLFSLLHQASYTDSHQSNHASFLATSQTPEYRK